MSNNRPAATSSIMPSDAPVVGEQSPGSEAYFRTLVEGMPQLVWRSCDMGRWTWSSPQWMAFTGQTQEQSHDRGWMEAVHPDDHAHTIEAWADARPHGLLDVEFRVREAATGNYLWHRTRSAPSFDAEGRIFEWLGTTTNVHELKTLQIRQAELLEKAERHATELEAEIDRRKVVEDKLSYTAFHDDLTRLHNRAYFMGQLRRALSGKEDGTVLILDLDGFKLVNDSLGHRTGDLLLSVLANRLRRCLGADTTVARIGGDEFGLLVDEMDDPGLVALANRIGEAIRKPVTVGRRQVICTGSLGATRLAARHAKPEDVLQEADAAMYLAKRNTPGRFLLFQPHMLEQAGEALDIRTELVDAVTRNELELHYQPIFGASSDVVGFEALVRWRNPRLDLLQPGSFIPAAEESGAINEIGRWVLAEGCAQLRRWRQQFPGTELTLNLNVCSRELKDPAYLDTLKGILRDTGVEPGQLELEITESVFLEHSDAVLQMLAALRALGIRIAIDDFGTGYSSLDYLDRYEVDTVKIDRSFIGRMLTEPRTRPILAAVMGLGHALSVRVVAEGVETAEQLSALTKMGCNAVQGFHLGRPAVAATFDALLAVTCKMASGLQAP